MSEIFEPVEDEGLDPGDRPRALRLIFKRHGRINVRPTAPTRIEIYRDRTGQMEVWEVIAWLPLHSEFIAWRRDTNYDDRLKAKEFPADDFGHFDGRHVHLADHWVVDPFDDDDGGSGEFSAPASDPVTPADDTFLRALDLGLTDPNSADLAKYGKRPPPAP